MRNQFSNQRQSRAPLFGALMVVVLIIVAVFGLDTLTGGIVRSYARTIGTVSWSAVASVSTSIDQSGFFSTRRALATENEELRASLALRYEEAVRYQALVEQNETLKAAARLAESEGKGITARIQSSFRSSPYGTFIIGAGKNQGVTRGSIVLTPGGFVLGTVRDLDTHTATVEALFAAGKSVDLIIGETAFTAEGRGGGNARAELPRDAKITLGDIALSPLHGGRSAGMVGEIISASSSAIQQVFIRLPVNLDTLTFVYVIPYE